MTMPGGTITFLFTDIEGSTRLWERRTSAMSRALAAHDKIVRAAVEQHDGHVFKTWGDAFCAAFATAADAIAAALDVQLGVTSAQWGDAPIAVRCALHSGAAEQRDGDYFGPALNRVARLLSAAHGGQTLLSQVTLALAQEALPPACTLCDLGTHRLRDLEQEEHIFQLLHPGLPADFPPIRTLRARHDNLPPDRTAFIGREVERAELRALLLRSDVSLVTLTGAGGCGKTRLALHAAGDCIEDFADGASFVPLAAITDPGLVAPAIAQALHLREGGDRPIEDVLREYVHGKALLLLLDNFEQVLDAASLVADLTGGRGAKVLVTSRAPLHLYGEREFPVPALDTPASLDAATVAQCSASRLFIERAQASDPRFAVTDENAPAIAEICSRLDGLPLAIELAAARARLLSPQAILNRLETRLGLLTGGARDLPERQRTMRGAIEWSHALLDEHECVLFRRLGVFLGGFTLDAAEEVCALDARDDVLSGVASLLDKSLLRAESAGTDQRLRMLETIREYALERLDASGELALMRERHAAWSLHAASRASDDMHGPRQLASLARCEGEHDNFRAALAWFAEREGPQGLRLAVALAPFWRLHSHLAEGRQWLAHGLALAGEAANARVRAEALLWSGSLAMHAGDHAAAKTLADQAARLAADTGQPALHGRACTTEGWCAIARGNVFEAVALCQHGVDLLRPTDDRWGLADALHFLGHAQADQTGLESARPSWEESLQLFRELGDAWSQAQPLKDLGLIAARVGDHAVARALYEDSLASLREIGDKWHVADALMRLGELALFSAQPVDAANRFREALSIARDLDNKTVIAEALMRYAEVSETTSDFVAARAFLEEALAIARGLAHDRLIAAALHNLAYVALHDADLGEAQRMLAGCTAIHRALDRDLEVALDIAAFAALAHSQRDHRFAAWLFGASDALRAGADAMLNRSDRLEFAVGQEARTASLRAVFGDEAFERAWAEGRSLSRDAVLDLADRLAAPAGERNVPGVT